MTQDNELEKWHVERSTEPDAPPWRLVGPEADDLDADFVLRADAEWFADKLNELGDWRATYLSLKNPRKVGPTYTA